MQISEIKVLISREISNFQLEEQLKHFGGFRTLNTLLSKEVCGYTSLTCF